MKQYLKNKASEGLMNLSFGIQMDLYAQVILPVLFIVCILSYIPYSNGDSECQESSTFEGPINFEIVDFNKSVIHSIGYGHQCIFSDVISSIKLDLNQIIVINFDNPKSGNLEIFIPNDLLEDMKDKKTDAELMVWINGKQTEINKIDFIDGRHTERIVFQSPSGTQEILIGFDKSVFSNLKCSEINKHSLLNIRGEPVCVKNNSILSLMHRGYLQELYLSDEVLDKLALWSFVKSETKEDEMEWQKYITVSASKIDHLEIPNTLPVYEIDDLSNYPKIERLLAGANGCKNKTEMCSISRGISIDRMYSFGISVTDSDQYTVTIDSEQAENLIVQIQWYTLNNLAYSVVSYNDGHYLLVLSTFDDVGTPDVAMKLIGVSSDPVALQRNSVIEYTIQINTWATYGTDAEIALDSIDSARDSGIKTWIEPGTLIVPERSGANATLFVHAPDTAMNGIYDIRIGGKANGKNAGLHCGHMDCPTVQIGGSDWSIRTFGSDTGMGIGSGSSPENSYLEIELNKEEFFDGEIVEIKAYLVNNGTTPIVLNEPMSLLVKAIRADSKGYYDHFYGIDARNESGNAIIVEPNSKMLLVRPFYWDQMTFENLDDEHRTEQGSRKMTATLVAREYTWKDNTWFEIR